VRPPLSSLFSLPILIFLSASRSATAAPSLHENGSSSSVLRRERGSVSKVITGRERRRRQQRRREMRNYILSSTFFRISRLLTSQLASALQSRTSRFLFLTSSTRFALHPFASCTSFTPMDTPAIFRSQLAGPGSHLPSCTSSLQKSPSHHEATTYSLSILFFRCDIDGSPSRQASRRSPISRTGYQRLGRISSELGEETRRNQRMFVTSPSFFLSSP
jgi:hypothetical protein